MNIVLEGPDNAGKSTLAKTLSAQLMRPVYASEGPEHFPGELIQRVRRYSGLKNVIFDRHPCVSDIVYSAFREKRSPLAGEEEAKFYYTKPLFIYCDPLDRGMIGHTEKSHDSTEHLNMLLRHGPAITQLYRQWAVMRAHINYRIGDDVDRIVRFCRGFDPVADVAAFHKRFNRHYEGLPRLLPADLAQFREDFAREELDEYVKTARGIVALMQDWADLNHPVDRNVVTSALADLQDALVDAAYITLGTAHLHGFNFYEGWERVHRANMTKIPAKRRTDSTRGSVYDIIKPEDFEPPNHGDLVNNHIHG